MENKVSFLKTGCYNVKGYPGKIIDYTVNNQLLDEKTWEVFVNQYRIHSDKGNSWRGEFWGKMMRGGSLTYAVTKNEKLYKVLSESIRDIISTQDEWGRISTVEISEEFKFWDMWSRKYVMLGLLYFLEICKSNALKGKITLALKKHANYIINHVGTEKGKKNIYDTSEFWGALNSASVIEPFVKLYVVTKEKKYLDFAEYIIKSGCSKDFDLIKTCYEKKLYPYQFKYVKAYEMMSCIEGVFEYYKVTGDGYYLTVAKNFVDMVLESDYTIIGCCGCKGEMFDNSSVTQTEYSDEVMQETCVTVTFMKLCAKLYLNSGEEKYIDVIERSGLNALFGAVNNEKQDMHRAVGPSTYDVNEYYYEVKHEPFPFDSYSPLYKNTRAKRVGGFLTLQNDRSYGCCACIGSAGTALYGLIGVVQSKDGLYLNLYHDAKYDFIKDGERVSVKVKANPYCGNKVKIKVCGNLSALNLRIPKWMENVQILQNGVILFNESKNGYLRLNNLCGENVIEIKYKSPIKSVVLNNKVAFIKGNVVLARDCRLGDVSVPIKKKIKNGGNVGYKTVKNVLFNTNLLVEIKTDNGIIKLCDYSQAGKNYDEDDCVISVWQDYEE